MKRFQSVKPTWIATAVTGIVAIVFAVGAVTIAIRWVSQRQEANCRSTERLKTEFRRLDTQLRPLAKIKKPGETDEQYTFRQEQNAKVEKLVARALAKTDC